MSASNAICASILLFLNDNVTFKTEVCKLHRFEREDLWTEGLQIYEGWNFNSGNYLFTTDTK